MNYEDIPSQIEAILSENAEWAALGIPVFRDIHHLLGEDLDSAENEVSGALLDKGLILGLESFAATTTDQAKGGSIVHAVPRCILIENPRVNRTSGLNVMPAKAARILISALLGQPEDSPLNTYFHLPDGVVFEPYRDANGRLEYPIRLQIQTQF